MSASFFKRIAIALLIGFLTGEGYQAYLHGVPVGEEINGIVTYVIDGDTIRVNGVKLRLWGVDAPEQDQKGYRQATDTMRQNMLRSVSCIIHDKDRYNRLVAQCFREKVDIGAEVIASGWARDYRRHSKGYYLKDELSAKRNHKGLWKNI